MKTLTYLLLLAMMSSSLFSCEKDDNFDQVKNTNLRKVQISSDGDFFFSFIEYKAGSYVVFVASGNTIIIEPKMGNNWVYPVKVMVYTQKNKLIDEREIRDITEIIIK